MFFFKLHTYWVGEPCFTKNISERCCTVNLINKRFNQGLVEAPWSRRYGVSTRVWFFTTVIVLFIYWSYERWGICCLLLLFTDYISTSLIVYASPPGCMFSVLCVLNRNSVNTTDFFWCHEQKDLSTERVGPTKVHCKH